MQDPLIEPLLRRYWAEECEALGESVVHDVVSGDHELASVEGASYIDLAEIIKAVADAVITIKTILEIYKLLRDQLRREPTSEELDDAVSKHKLAADQREKAHLVILDLCGSAQRT